MKRRRRYGTADGLLVIGFALGVAGLIAITTPLADLASIFGPSTFGRTASPIAPPAPHSQLDKEGLCRCSTPHWASAHHGAAIAVSAPPALASSASPPGTREHRVARGDEDARDYLRDAAAAARRAGSGTRGGVTSSDLWINAPASIGSTSPRRPSPVATPLEE